MTIAKQNSLASVIAVAVFAFVALAFGTSAHAQTNYTLEENGSYFSSSGTFNVDSSCGLRGACKWVYNQQYSPSSTLTWDFAAAHTALNDHYYYHYSDQYAFIPLRGTTHAAKYCTKVWRYVPPNAPYQDSSTYCMLGLDQYSYANAFAQVYVAPTYASELTFSRLDNATGENVGWYSVVWDAYKAAYN